MMSWILILCVGLTFVFTANGQECYGTNSGISIDPGLNTVQELANVDLDGCCKACHRNPACQAYVWSKSVYACLLKSTTGPVVRYDDHISGYKYSQAVAVPTQPPTPTTHAPAPPAPTTHAPKQPAPTPKPQPIPPTQECYNINSGIAVAPGGKSNQIEKLTQTDLSGCCKACNRNPLCQAFVWSKSTFDCYLKDVTTPVGKNADRISGFRHSPVPEPQDECYDINSGVVVGQGPHQVQHVTHTDLAGCCKACHRNPSCKAFVWSKSTSDCYLKDDTTVTGKNADRISGFRNKKH